MRFLSTAFSDPETTETPDLREPRSHCPGKNAKIRTLPWFPPRIAELFHLLRDDVVDMMV
jgi:hypothetical protein